MKALTDTEGAMYGIFQNTVPLQDRGTIPEPPYTRDEVGTMNDDVTPYGMGAEEESVDPQDELEAERRADAVWADVDAWTEQNIALCENRTQVPYAFTDTRARPFVRHCLRDGKAIDRGELEKWLDTTGFVGAD